MISCLIANNRFSSSIDKRNQRPISKQENSVVAPQRVEILNIEKNSYDTSNKENDNKESNFQKEI